MPRLNKRSVVQSRLENRRRMQILRANSLYRASEQSHNTQSQANRRLDPEVRLSEQSTNTVQHRTRRQNQEVRSAEQSINTVQHRSRRENPEIRSAEQIIDTNQHRTRRQNPQFRSEEQSRNTREHRSRRENPNLRSAEQSINTVQHRSRRENPELRSAEQSINTVQHRSRRENPEIRLAEQIVDTNQHRTRRQNPQFRSEEQSRNTREHRSRRENPNLRSAEQSINTVQHRSRRENPEIRLAEQIIDTNQHRTRRQNPQFRSEEQSRNTQEHRIRRQNPIIRSNEQSHNTVVHRELRRNPNYRHLERIRDQIQRERSRRNPETRREERYRETQRRQLIRRGAREQILNQRRQQQNLVRIHRENLTNRQIQNERQSQRNILNRENNVSDIFANGGISRDFRSIYFENIKKGPTEICICCGGLWFPHQVRKLNFGTIAQVHPDATSVFFLKQKFPSEDGNYNFCLTCKNGIAKNNIPKICLLNGLDFPDIPDCLKNLTPIEERLIMPRLPFMTIRPLGYQGQSSIKGAVVNIPISVNNVVTSLPRTFDQTHVIQIHLRRRMEYNHDYMTDTIRPAKVMEALRFLVNTPLYREHNIHINENWISGFNNQEEVPFVASAEDDRLVQSLYEEQTSHNNHTDIPIAPVPAELNPGSQETLLDNIPIENMEYNRLVIAPGEGQRPIDIVQDNNSEELSFGTIYVGQKRTCSETYSKIVRSEIRRFDRRACTIPKLFYDYKKLELLQIKNSTSICLRKFSGRNRVTAQNVLNENFVQNLIQHDDGYKVLKGVRSSPAHWEAEKKKAIAMIRQFGLPTFFITLSAAESQWVELLVILSKTVDSKDISQEEANILSTQDRYRLIRSDAVTCARYFDYRYRQILKLFKDNTGIFGTHFVKNYYWRVEFQQRGSPHIHGMYWLNNAPKINLQSPETFSEVIDFIDTYVSTDSSVSHLEHYLDYQKHNHSRSCTREIRGQQFCRFGIPYPPMPCTQILLPFPDTTQDLERHKENFSRIQNVLNSTLTTEDISNLDNFENFLSDNRINMSFDDYLLALRSSLSKPKIFLKRKMQDRFINAYNPLILELHRANMDIQYILDAYACCSYIINYINKSNRGISRLLNEAISEVNAGNYTIKQKLQHIGHKFISGTEISAQEAVYCCIGLHLSEASNGEIFINTSRPEERVRMVKPRAELQNLPSDSTEIFVAGILDRYVQRPDQLETVCLADFASMFKFVKSNRIVQDSDHEEEEREDNNVPDIGVPIALRDGSGFVKKRTKPIIIRYRRFSPDVTKVEYFREMVMLFYPWRNEQEDLIENDNELTCITHRILIEGNRKKYDVFDQRELESVLESLYNETDLEEAVQNELPVVENEFRVLALPEISPNINLLDLHGEHTTDNGTESDCNIRLIKLPPLISVEELFSLVQSLNIKQRTYLTHLMHQIKTSRPFYEFIGGGAGVGKSRLISAIYQALNHRFNSTPGSIPSSLKVLLCAPTGKAAFGIGGLTLHSIFSLPVNQLNRELRPLSSDIVNSLYSKLADLKLIIIDEISMVGARMFSYVDARLKQIFKTNNPFGGIPIIVFGDLKQLSPVGDRWIFSSNSNDAYSTLVGSPLWDLFKYFELTEIMRQRDDQAFAIALNRMASGTMTNDDISLIQTRVVNSEEVPDDAIHLFWSNEETNNFNALKLSRITTEAISSTAKDSVRGMGIGDQQGNILERVQLFKTSETQGLPYQLTLKTTAKYMITVNINTCDGLVNGATGELMQIDYPVILWIKFLEPSVGLIARSKKPHPLESSWTPIEKVIRSFQYKRNEQIIIERNQFPVVPAEGITIHKSQGATYNKVVVHTRPRMPRASIYVACSRATTAVGLFIIGNFIPPNKFSESDPVFREMMELSTSKALITSFDFMISRSSALQILYHNAQSLHAHINDIKGDCLMLSSDILCFVETWSTPVEHFEIPGFTLINELRIDSTETSNRNKRGLIIYAKHSVASSIEPKIMKKIYSDRKVLEAVLFKCFNNNILVLYRNSAFPLRLFIAELQEILTTELCNQNVLIVGDFNICLKSAGSTIKNLLQDKNFSSLLSVEYSTTPAGRQIDWAFSNMDHSHVDAITYETVHSYHDGICVSISD
ncbi:uncharacterized protein LOC126765663 [Bactrocera neohumeralis]|uniref:uncharacterized protein LOC126765663 n=1 Tax=Bactrocera neohumeralis TaxID=98809 RepID=UPI002166AD8B|nr:uncharacterized protein LOC126765663 [Bactrocera neohumeralis]